jgi:hypothetical protein
MTRNDIEPEEYSRLEKVASNFMCYVCGAIFNTEEDRRQHLEKEMRGKLREGTTAEEKETARHQEEVNESHHHRV